MSEFADDRRLTSRVLKYWSRLAPEHGEMPLYGRFQKDAMADVWQQCMIVSLLPSEAGATRLKCEEMGQEAMKLLGKKTLTIPITKNTHHKMLGKQFILASETAIRRMEPAYDAGHFLGDKHEVVKYRVCFLPFVNSHQQVTHLLVGLSWRTFV